MSKMLLNTTVMQEDFFADAALIGIASALPGHRFCWLLNRHFDTDFTRDPDQDLWMQVGTNRQVYFPIYQHKLPLSEYKYLLYKLKNGKETLLPETRQLDYLWMVEGNTPESDAMHFIHSLRDIAEVQLAQLLEPQRLKNLEHLLV